MNLPHKSRDKSEAKKCLHLVIVEVPEPHEQVRPSVDSVEHCVVLPVHGDAAATVEADCWRPWYTAVSC